MVWVIDISPAGVVSPWTFGNRRFQSPAPNRNAVVSWNVWIPDSAFSDTIFCLENIFFSLQRTNAGKWEVFIFGDLANCFNDDAFTVLDHVEIRCWLGVCDMIWMVQFSVFSSFSFEGPLCSNQQKQILLYQNRKIMQNSEVFPKNWYFFAWHVKKICYF